MERLLFSLSLLIARARLSEDGSSPRPRKRATGGSVMGSRKFAEGIWNPTDGSRAFSGKVEYGMLERRWVSSPQCAWAGARSEQIAVTASEIPTERGCKGSLVGPP